MWLLSQSLEQLNQPILIISIFVLAVHDICKQTISILILFIQNRNLIIFFHVDALWITDIWCWIIKSFHDLTKNKKCIRMYANIEALIREHCIMQNETISGFPRSTPLYSHSDDKKKKHPHYNMKYWFVYSYIHVISFCYFHCHCPAYWCEWINTLLPPPAGLDIRSIIWPLSWSLLWQRPWL